MQNLKVKFVLPIMLMGMALSACSPAAETSPNLAPETPMPAEFNKRTSEMKIKNRDAAAEQFAYQEGLWDSKWVYASAEEFNSGEPLVRYGTQEYKTIVGGNGQSILTKIGETTDINVMDTTINIPAEESFAFVSFNAYDQSINSHHVGSKGMDWTMTQVPTSDVSISEDMENPDGSATVIKYTVVRKEANAMDIKIEGSYDRGETWKVSAHQYLTRAVIE